jgi:hypothetical protein
MILSISLTAGGRRNLAACPASFVNAGNLKDFVSVLPLDDDSNGNDLACLTDAITFASGLSSPAKTFNPSNDLLPGVYTMAAATSLAGTLTLDSNGDPTAVWIFQIGGALTTAAASQMDFKPYGSNTGSAANVFWIVNGAATIGAGTSTTVVGTIMASGAITVGASATTGALLSSGGAITVGAGATVNGALVALGAISLGAGASSTSLTTTAAVTLGAGASSLGQLSSDLGGVILAPGSYVSGAAISLTGILYFDASSHLDVTVVNAGVDLWTLEVGGAFSTAVSSKMVFLRDSANKISIIAAGSALHNALSSKVSWTAIGAMSLGVSSVTVGNLHSDGAISMGAGATAIGILDAVGAVSLGAGASAPGQLSADLGGATLVPGQYGATAAIGLTGILKLDASAYIDAASVATALTSNIFSSTYLWKFTIGAAFSTAASSRIVFIDRFENEITAGSPLYNALSAAVLWDVTGAIALGANSIAVGNMESDAAIALGAGATSIGELISSSGGAVTLGAGASAPGKLPSDLSGITLQPGSYSSGGATVLTGGLPLTLALTSSDTTTTALNLWTLTIGAAFGTAAASNVVFTLNGNEVIDAASINSYSDKVIWDVTGAIALGAGSNMVGNMKSGAAIALGAGATSIGVLTSTGGGAVTLGTGASAPNRLPGDLSGVYLAPGTYGATSAISLTGNMYLVLPSDYLTAAAVWEITIEFGAFAVAAGANVYFVASDLTTLVDEPTLYAGSSVSWIVDGAISLGASSHVIGALHSNAGAIALGAGASSGAQTTDSGAIALGAGAYCTDKAGVPVLC